MAQVVEYLPSKCEYLSSNPATARKRKKKKFPDFLGKWEMNTVFIY
jgi:hypothetical protein